MIVILKNYLGDSILVKLDILIYFQRWRRRRTRSSCRKVSFPSRYSCCRKTDITLLFSDCFEFRLRMNCFFYLFGLILTCSSSSCCFRVVVTHLNSASPGNLWNYKKYDNLFVGFSFGLL